VNWALGIDKQGRPIPDPAKEPAPDGRLIAPDEGGLTNFRSPSFDPKTGLFIVDAHPATASTFPSPPTVPTDGPAPITACGQRRDRGHRLPDRQDSLEPLRCPDGAGAGVLTTDSGLTFTGDAFGNVLALDTANGKTLWHAARRSMENAPITYELEGRQYLLTGSGPMLFAWKLPESAGCHDARRAETLGRIDSAPSRVPQSRFWNLGKARFKDSKSRGQRPGAPAAVPCAKTSVRSAFPPGARNSLLRSLPKDGAFCASAACAPRAPRAPWAEAAAHWPVAARRLLASMIKVDLPSPLPRSPRKIPVFCLGLSAIK